MSVITCEDISTIQPSKWLQLLHDIDMGVTNYFDESEVIILSLPTPRPEIKQILTDYLISNQNEFCIFSCDIIIDFLVFDYKQTQNKMPQITKSIHYSLLNENSLSIIHCKSGEIFSLPRKIYTELIKLENENETFAVFQCIEDEDYMRYLKLEFMNHPKYFDIIKNCVYNKMCQIFPKSNFKLIDADWSNKSEFYGIFRIGYRYLNGKIVCADIIMQKDRKIFVHFGNEVNENGLKFSWISVPNDRITPPPKTMKINTNFINADIITSNLSIVPQREINDNLQMTDYQSLNVMMGNKH